MTALDVLRHCSAYVDQGNAKDPARGNPDEYDREIKRRLDAMSDFSLRDFFPLSEQERKIARTLDDRQKPSIRNQRAYLVATLCLRDYKSGELRLKQMLRTVRAGSLFCETKVRALLMGWLCDQALTISPKRRNVRKPVFSASLRILAAGVVVRLREAMPPNTRLKGERPRARTPGTLEPTVLRTAIEEFSQYGVTSTNVRLTEKRLHAWYLEFKPLFGVPSVRGRPRKK